MPDIEEELRDGHHDRHGRHQDHRIEHALEARGAQVFAVKLADRRHTRSYLKTKPRRKAGLQVSVIAGGLGAAREEVPGQRAPDISATPEPDLRSTSLVSRRKIAPTTSVMTATTIGYQRPA